MKRENIVRERKRLARQFERMLSDQSTIFFDTHAFEKIMEYYEEKVNFAKALKAANCALEQYPFSAVFLLKKGEYLLELKRPEKALYCLEKALIFDPADLRIYFITSDAHLELEEYEKALDVLHDAIDMSDKNELPDVYLEIADVYEEMEQPEMVAKYLKKSLWKSPRHQEAHGRYQFITELNDWNEQAIEFLNKLSDRDPYAKTIWLNMGNAYCNLEQFENAAEAYEVAIAIDEDYDIAYEELGSVYFKMQKYELAIENLKQAVKRNKSLGLESSYFLLGKCHSDLKEWKKAIYFYNKAVKLDVTYYEAYYELACCYFELDNLNLASDYICKALEENTKDFDYNLMAANILLCLEKFDQAQYHIDLLMKRKISKVEDLTSVSEVLFQNGQGDQAVELHTIIFELAPVLRELNDVTDLIILYKK